MDKTQTKPQKQEKYQYPSEEVTLPSKGLLYSKGSPLRKGFVEMKYMTAREEDILTNQNYIKNGTVIDKLMQSLIITPINYDSLLIGDKNAILVAARILGYGQKYNFGYPHPVTGETEEISVDLTEAKDKELDESLVKDGKNEFEFTLPISKTLITFKLLDQKDEQDIVNEMKGLKKINKDSSPEVTTRMKHTILSVNGNYEKKAIRDFVDNAFLARDSRAFRDYILEIMPDIDLHYDIEFSDGLTKDDVMVPIGVGFFWPDVGV